MEKTRKGKTPDLWHAQPGHVGYKNLGSGVHGRAGLRHIQA